MRYRMIPIDGIIEDILEFTDNQEASIPQIKKHISELSRKMETEDQMVHKVSLIDIDGYTGELPIDEKLILQVAFKEDGFSHRHKRIEIKEWVKQAYDGCEIKVTMDCPECHEETCEHDAGYTTIEADDLWRQQHPEYMYMHMDHLYRWGGLNKKNIPQTSPYCSEFRIIRYAQHYYTNSSHHLQGCANLDPMCADCEVEYTINNGIIKVNREKGQILLAYMANQTDKDGYNLIPDIPEFVEAAKWYIEEMTTWKSWRKSKKQADYMSYNSAKSSRLKLQGVINEILLTPDYGVWMSWLSNRWKRDIKDHNYYGNSNAYHHDSHRGILNNLSRK